MAQTLLQLAKESQKTIDYNTAMKNIAENGRFVPIGETTWHNSQDSGIYIGTFVDDFGNEEPTFEKKIADAALFNAITDDLELQRIPKHKLKQRGLEAAIVGYKPEDIYKALDSSVHDIFNVYSALYAPELKKGKKFRDIGYALKQRGQGAATLGGETFATLRNTNTQFQAVRYLSRPRHIIKDLLTQQNVTSLDPVRFATFEGSDSIKEKVGEFETPTTGLGRYTQHQYTIDKYIGGFNIAPSFFQYDMGQYDIIGDHLKDQVGEIDVIMNKRAYELMIGAGVPTTAATGSYSLLASGLNVNNPMKDIAPIVYTMNTAGRTSKANFILMNGNYFTTFQTSSFLGPNTNPNDTGRAVQPTVARLQVEDNTILGAGTIVGLPNLSVAIDSMMSDANGIVIGSSDFGIFGNGPSSSRSFVDQRSEVLMRQNKWWFGTYLYDDVLVRRITGGA